MVIQGAPPWATVGAVLALIILVLAILGLVGVLPFTATVVFGLIGGLALSRLL
jgi:hypothetical protein